MSELKICRICLRTEAKVYHYEQFQLKAYYEEVLAMKVTEKDDLPHYFCFECATLLHKFHKFKEKCFAGQKVLKEMLKKGPAGILEQLKLNQEASFNMEMSSPLCCNSSSQDIEVYENSLVDTDIDINELPIVTDGITTNDPVEIDSFFINNLNVVHHDERMIGDSNISNQTLDKVKPFQNQTAKIGSNVSHGNTINFDVKNLLENVQSPIVICELPSIDSNPIESLDNGNDEPSSAIYCDLSSVPQIFDETNLQYVESNLTLDSQNEVADFNMGNVTDNESSPIIHLPSTSKYLSKSHLLYKKTNEEKKLKQVEQSNKIEEKTIKYLNSLNTQISSFNAEQNVQIDVEEDVERAKLYLLNKNHRYNKVRLASKNRLAPNIHSVTLPTTSEQYFDALDDLNIENDSHDSLNQLNVDHDCPVDTMSLQTRKKKKRKKYTATKQVKPIPCHKKCGNKCSVRVTELDRQVIHERYWKMDKQEQQEWLLSCIKPKDIRRRQGATMIKTITYDYFVFLADKNVKVCQQFLMKTLDVSQMRFRYAISKLGSMPDSKSENKCSDSDTDSS